MADTILKFVLKAALIIWIVIFIIWHIASICLNSFFLPMLFLFLGLMLIKYWLPSLYNFMKRLLSWTLKAAANWLWRKGEKKGGASVRQPRMRWRP